MKIGTKSVLFGAHCFFLHPFFVAWAWFKLYGFPWDPRLWVAFFVHDLGYIGKPNMDGPEGERHPELGARIMDRLFDRPGRRGVWAPYVSPDNRPLPSGKWATFCLTHSRYYAKALGLPFSRLCVADKLAFNLTPRWLYLPMVRATGELEEYLTNSRKPSDSGKWDNTNIETAEQWHERLCAYMTKWVEQHRDSGGVDTWTKVRYA